MSFMSSSRAFEFVQDPPDPREIWCLYESNRALLFGHVLNPENAKPRPKLPEQFSDWDGEDLDVLLCSQVYFDFVHALMCPSVSICHSTNFHHQPQAARPKSEQLDDNHTASKFVLSRSTAPHLPRRSWSDSGLWLAYIALNFSRSVIFFSSHASLLTI
jgi:hypothetical protein